MADSEICGKRPVVGRRVTLSGERNRRIFKPNVHKMRVMLPDGTVKRMYVCTKCLKAGKVMKAPRIPKEG
ncbi:50S ribosomal protein L28 [Aquifex aeolicus]|uniref:Large ribosomal subunit protein bL28 n=1 Tax=Aquifex aeolicus (strain VF5) TaxID=224324 RepID=RL28_AQUAE|nr:50S ribosomal protein L28 [Aquifex aeolicus]O66492.1 RecName: Full=Large ribosomal subunit protein bL28; AltName: Full=50S ribosomal protein L28 [Aquifex aeolicus VF5]AAC06455.1 ribosomal protein L28 [Aquifex aeolicus VF5]